MSALEFDHQQELSCVFNLESRNIKAQSLITNYALGHAAMDVGIGLAGLIPIPGLATMSMIGAIIAQVPVIYEPMTRDLAAIYGTQEDATTDTIQQEAMAIGAIADIGVEFLKEIAIDLIAESGIGLAVSALPIFGGIAAAGLDAIIAATLTWRVGTMASAYYLNGAQWIESRRHTYDVAAKAVEGWNARPHNRADLNKFARETPPIANKQLQFVMSLIDLLKPLAASKEQVREMLLRKRIPAWLIEAGLQAAYPF